MTPTNVEPRWLNTQQQAAWRAYIEVIGDLMNALETDLHPTGLTLGDYQVLVHLSETPDHRLRMCDLAERLQLSPSGLTRRLDGLVSAGLVRREPSPEDRRVMHAVLTAKGWAVLGEAAPIHVNSVRHRIFDHLQPDEVTALQRIFTAIAAGLVEES